MKVSFVWDTLLGHNLDKERSLTKVATDKNIADILTKPLSRVKHEFFMKEFGMMKESEFLGKRKYNAAAKMKSERNRNMEKNWVNTAEEANEFEQVQEEFLVELLRNMD